MWSVGGLLVLLTALSRADIAADKPLVLNHSLVKAFPCLAPAKTMNCRALLVSLTWSHVSLDLASHWHSLAAVSFSPVALLPQSRVAEVQLPISPTVNGPVGTWSNNFIFLLSENCLVWICGWANSWGLRVRLAFSFIPAPPKVWLNAVIKTIKTLLSYCKPPNWNSLYIISKQMQFQLVVTSVQCNY